MLGTQIWGDRMEGINESTELWWHPYYSFLLCATDILTKNVSSARRGSNPCIWSTSWVGRPLGYPINPTKGIGVQCKIKAQHLSMYCEPTYRYP